MEKKVMDYEIPKALADTLIEILDHKGCLEDEADDAILERIEVDFKDGITVEIDVCNGGRDDDSSPYVNVNWYQDGEALFAFGSEPEKLIGEYSMMTDDEDTYVVNLVVAENAETINP